MAALWLVTALALAAHDREPLLLHVTGQVDARGAEAIAAAAGDALSTLTLLSARRAEKTRLLAACEERGELMCWLRAARGADVRPRYFLGVTVQPGRGARSSAALLLIDLERGERWASAASSGEAAEDEIFETAAVAFAGEVDASSPDALRAYFERFFAGPARGRLEASGHWFPNGAIEVESDIPGLTVTIDDRPEGPPGTTIADLSEGKHTVHVTDPRGLVAHAPETVTVVRGKVTTVTPTLTAGTNPAPAIRQVVTWSGVALAAAGVGLAVYAAAAPKRAFVARVCPGGACPDADAGFAGFGDLGTTPLEPGGGGGVRAAPLGFALLAGGACWTAGTLALGEDWELPWLPLLVGAAAGAATYGITAAVR